MSVRCLAQAEELKSCHKQLHQLTAKSRHTALTVESLLTLIRSQLEGRQLSLEMILNTDDTDEEGGGEPKGTGIWGGEEEEGILNHDPSNVFINTSECAADVIVGDSTHNTATKIDINGGAILVLDKVTSDVREVRGRIADWYAERIGNDCSMQ